MGEAGRPTDLTEEVFEKIRESILAGNDLRETAKICKINEGTFYQWHSRNYSNLSDKIEGWRRDRKLLLAERNIVEFLEMDTKNLMLKGKELVEQTDTGLVKVKADISKFVAETLGRDNYSKRNELTGKDGKDLNINLIKYEPDDSSQL